MLIQDQEKEAEAKKKEEASEEKKENKEMRFRPYPTVPTIAMYHK
jgi:hypothetical protein